MLAEREWLVNLEATDRQTDGQPNEQSSGGDEALELWKTYICST